MDLPSIYDSWTLPQIKAELRKRGMKISGRKKDLITRLEFCDRNAPGKVTQSQEPEYRMMLPNVEQFKDAHQGMAASFPQINMARVKEYLSQFDKDFDEKCKDMYSERYLRYFRIATCIESGKTFVSSTVWAEMKKSVAYKVELCMDDNGVVDEAQCECGAGQGPTAHCKHVATVLYASVRFVEDTSVLSELTCTQVLQTFHKSKPHKGSPLKASNLQALRNRERRLQFDPRPAELRATDMYPGYFRNLCINYSGARKMPVRQLYKPANIPALSHDHDYMAETMEDHFLRQLEVTSITQARVAEIERATRDQASSLVWGEERKKRITASMFGTICKMTDARDVDKLTSSICEKKNVKSAPVFHGMKYEAVAIEKFELLEGVQTSECGLFVHPELPFLAATPGRTIDASTLLEVKCPYASKDKEITHLTVPYLEITETGLSLRKNHNYYHQVQGQLLCSGCKSCKFVVFTLKDMKVVDINFDPEFVEDMIIKLKNFHEKHFKNAIIKHLFYKNYYHHF